MNPFTIFRDAAGKQACEFCRPLASGAAVGVFFWSALVVLFLARAAIFVRETLAKKNPRKRPRTQKPFRVHGRLYARGLIPEAPRSREGVGAAAPHRKGARRRSYRAPQRRSHAQYGPAGLLVVNTPPGLFPARIPLRSRFWVFAVSGLFRRYKRGPSAKPPR